MALSEHLRAPQGWVRDCLRTSSAGPAEVERIHHDHFPRRSVRSRPGPGPGIRRRSASSPTLRTRTAARTATMRHIQACRLLLLGCHAQGQQVRFILTTTVRRLRRAKPVRCARCTR